MIAALAYFCLLCGSLCISSGMNGMRGMFCIDTIIFTHEKRHNVSIDGNYSLHFLVTARLFFGLRGSAAAMIDKWLP